MLIRLPRKVKTILSYLNPSNQFTRDYFESLLPPIRLHSWGGLGSQLFALNAYFQIRNKYPGRRIRLLHHTGGVTRREFELEIVDLPVVIVEDYTDIKLDSITSKARVKKSIKVKIRGLFRKLLLVSGFFASANNEGEFSQMRRWVIEIRGHYTRLQISPNYLTKIDALVFSTLYGIPRVTHLENAICIHLRLGDLATEKRGSLVNPKALRKEIDKLPPSKSIFVFSDSSAHEMQTYLGLQRPLLFIEESNTAKVILMSSTSKVFIGSNSKITFWITAIRAHRQVDGVSIIPSNIYDWLIEVLHESLRIGQDIRYY